MTKEQIIEIAKHTLSTKRTEVFLGEGFKKICLIIGYEELADRILALQKKEEQKEAIIESFETENQYVTDEDIESWADKIIKNTYNDPLAETNRMVRAGMIFAAKAHRDGKIKV